MEYLSETCIFSSPSYLRLIVPEVERLDKLLASKCYLLTQFKLICIQLTPQAAD